MADYQAKKIPIFTGINDTPKAPDSLEGGNISHFYDLYNQLIDDLEEDVGEVQEIAGDALDIAERADSSSYDYYYYSTLPNRNYIIFQNHNTSFNLGNHDLNPGETTIGTIPTNGELFRIIAEGTINNHADILFKIGGEIISVPKFAFYSSGGIWWFYDVAEDYNNPYNGLSKIVTAGSTIKVVTSTAETNINFKLEMNVYGVTASQQANPVLDVYELRNLNTIDAGGNYVASIGIIAKTGKLQKIVISNIGDGYGTFFSIDGGNTVLSFDAFEIAQEGYQWTITDDGSQDVTQGDELTIQTTEEELDFTIFLYILG